MCTIYVNISFDQNSNIESPYFNFKLILIKSILQNSNLLNIILSSRK